MKLESENVKKFRNYKVIANLSSVFLYLQPFFPSSFPEGTLLSTRPSIFAIEGLGEPSGSGAGHLIRSVLLSHSWPQRTFRIMTMTNIDEVFGFWVTYLGIWAIAAQARILGGVRTLCLWFEE